MRGRRTYHLPKLCCHRHRREALSAGALRSSTDGTPHVPCCMRHQAPLHAPCTRAGAQVPINQRSWTLRLFTVHLLFVHVCIGLLLLCPMDVSGAYTLCAPVACAPAGLARCDQAIPASHTGGWCVVCTGMRRIIAILSMHRLARSADRGHAKEGVPAREAGAPVGMVLHVPRWVPSLLYWMTSRQHLPLYGPCGTELSRTLVLYMHLCSSAVVPLADAPALLRGPIEEGQQSFVLRQLRQPGYRR